MELAPLLHDAPGPQREAVVFETPLRSTAWAACPFQSAERRAFQFPARTDGANASLEAETRRMAEHVGLGLMTDFTFPRQLHRNSMP